MTGRRSTARQFVLVVPDGGADRYRGEAGTPFAAACLANLDALAQEGACGRMQTLFPDLPRESLVAHLGLLGWEPHRHYPFGRASSELLALGGVALADGDLAFRANLVRFEGDRLASYNADFISTRLAQPLVEGLQDRLADDFPDFELYHNADFRNTLVVRGAHISPDELECPEPHENQGRRFDRDRWICARSRRAHPLAERINRYLKRVRRLLDGPANGLSPWSASGPLRLPPFAADPARARNSAVVGAMDFLHGIACAGGMRSVPVGSGRPDTDYAAKGRAAVECLEEGCEFVLVHVNAPDEAAHMGDLRAKVESLEHTDQEVIGPVAGYFRRHPERLGCVAVLPDHYTNVEAAWTEAARCQAHSLEPVPFVLWDGGLRRDDVRAFSEEAAADGRWGSQPLSSLDLLPLMGLTAPGDVWPAVSSPRGAAEVLPPVASD